jgi:GT2 family glycosyltransferase
MRGPFHVTGRDGRELFGSPLDPAREQRETAAAAAMLARLYPADGRPRRSGPIAAPCLPAVPAGPPPAPPRARTCGVDVVIPVHGGRDDVLACLDSLLPTLPPGSRAVVVDDASPEPELVQALEGLAARGRIRLLRHRRNQGFPAAANTGIAACPGRDVVLLNSDTLVPPGWLQRLRAAVGSAPDIGTATPFSNEASILSYPSPGDANPAPDLAGTIALDRHARRANPGVVTEIPVGVGFCLYLRRACIDQVGLLRADVFAQGYGEENDFCLRARHLGWRSVAVPGVYVAHRGGASFGTAGRHLQRRNEALLNRLHPGYDALVKDFLAADPLAEARRRFDLRRWAAARRRGAAAAILVTHRDGGGVEQQIAAAAAGCAAGGLHPVVLRPAGLPGGRRGVAVDTVPAGGFPNLRFALPEERPALLRFLRQQQPERLDVHHLLGHPPEIYALIQQLGVPYTVHVHDYAWFCPRVSLVGGAGRYCGEPAPARCEACVADHGSFLEEDIGAPALRERSARFLAGAVRVETPAADAAARMRRHFPGLQPVVTPHEDDSAIPDPPPPAAPDGLVRICVPGAIGLHKGYDVLLGCARDAAERRLALEFVVVGHTTDDARLLATGRVFVTGEYRREEAGRLIAAQRATLGFLPSVWPETWSLSLTELWRAGLRVAAFDFGAPAERIRATGRGFVLPLGLSAAGINNALVAAAGLPVHEEGRTAPLLPVAVPASGSPVHVTQPVRARPSYV